MSEPIRAAHARRTSTLNRVGLLIGAAVLVLLVLLLAAFCGSGSGGNRAAPGPGTSTSPSLHPGRTATTGPSTGSHGPRATGAPTGPTTATAGAGAGPSPGARTASPATTDPTAGGGTSGGTAGGTGGGTAGGATAEPSGVAGLRAAPSADPIPSGAPHTGGGGGAGVRHPFLLGAGIVLLLAAAGLLVHRLLPRTLEP
jgi:hypothetical protein